MHLQRRGIVARDLTRALALRAGVLGFPLDVLEAAGAIAVGGAQIATGLLIEDKNGALKTGAVLVAAVFRRDVALPEVDEQGAAVVAAGAMGVDVCDVIQREIALGDAFFGVEGDATKFAPAHVPKP